MQNVAIIPVRGGSKSIPLKNIREMCGKPLVYWTVKAANNCSAIDKVYVSTDSAIIKETVESFGFGKVEVVSRSDETATDTASTESVMLEFASQHDFENIVLIQATSPLLDSNDLTKGFLAFGEKNTDSVLSVVRQKRFHWELDEDGFAKATNYDVFARPRRQEFEGYLVENGAFYITSRKSLLESRNRVSGKIKVVEMKEDTFYEIDEPDDWLIIENLLKQKLKAENDGFPKIKMFLTDCDGCLTDGGMYYSETGDELKKFNTKDGMGFKLLQERGILTGIITGEKVKLNTRRANKLKVNFFFEGCDDKLNVVKRICKENEIDLEQVAYVGDDINDKAVIEAVGLGCCVADANYEVKKVAKYITQEKGGHGAIREIIDMIIHNQ